MKFSASIYSSPNDNYQSQQPQQLQQQHQYQNPYNYEQNYNQTMENQTNYYDQSPQYQQHQQHLNQYQAPPQASYQAQTYPIGQSQEYPPVVERFTISKQNSSYIVSMPNKMER